MRGSVFSDKNLCLIIFKPLKSLHCRIESESTFFAMFAVVFRDIICGFPCRIHSGGLFHGIASNKTQVSSFLPNSTFTKIQRAGASTRLNLSQLKNRGKL